MKILCHGEVNKSEIEEKYDIDFDDYFSYELEKLKEFEEDGLVLCRDVVCNVSTVGQFFLRNIAAAFDFYLQKKNGKQKIYSKTV